MTKHYAGVVFAALFAGFSISSLLYGGYFIAGLSATMGLFQIRLMYHLIRERGLEK